jgi:hypothetical protein
MANSAPSGITVFYDNAGGTPVDITQYVLTINDIDVESVAEETHSFGDAWEESLPVGIGRVGVVELSGLYDDIVTVGPNALFTGRVPEVPGTAVTRTLTITWRTGKSTAFETYLLSYRRSADRNGLTKYTVRLQPTGAVTEV